MTHKAWNLPDDFNQAALDAYWGKPVSDEVNEGMAEHSEIQDLRIKLAEQIKACVDQTVAGHYEDLLAACENHEFTDAWMEAELVQHEQDEHEARRQDRYEND